jgi:phosphate transport system substrate-binding protein
MKTNKWILNRVLFTGLVILLSGAFETIAVAAESINWTGCGITKKAFMVEAAKAYKAKTGITVKLTGGGATKGVEVLIPGKPILGVAAAHVCQINFRTWKVKCG